MEHEVSDRTECKRTFGLEITTVRTYRTKRRIEDMPDGWNGGELQ